MNKKRVMIGAAIAVPIRGIVGFENTLFAQYMGVSFLRTYKQVQKSFETENNKFEFLNNAKGIQQNLRLKLTVIVL